MASRLGLRHLLSERDAFAPRHLGPGPAEVAEMLAEVGAPSLDALVADTVPREIRLERPLDLDPPRGER